MTLTCSECYAETDVVDKHDAIADTDEYDVIKYTKCPDCGNKESFKV